MGNEFIGFSEALKRTLGHITPLEAVELPLIDNAHHICAKDVCSLVDSPSDDASLRDGFAVRSEDSAHASPETPVKLLILDTAAAGLPSTGRVENGAAIRVLTGATIPEGADAVVSEEFTERMESHVVVTRHAESRRNILPKGIDLRKSERIVRAGDVLNPGKIGLIAASGHAKVWVIPKPRVAIIATGDEIVWPGKSLPDGKLYASNLMTLYAWCSQFHMTTRLAIVPDDMGRVTETLDGAARENDAVLTSGGAWTGDRDLVAKALQQLGWQKIYHRVRMGPGKAVGFGMLYNKPVFILPGGPPSNLVAFLFLALPALFKLCGNKSLQLSEISVKFKETIRGKKDWTQFVFGQLEYENEHPLFRSIKWPSRLKSIAAAHCIVLIPEGIEQIPEGTNISATLLNEQRL